MTKNLTVIVCKGASCSLLGGSALVHWCEALANANLPIKYGVSPCTGNCNASPVVEWNGAYLTECTPEKLTQRLIDDEI